MLARNFGEGTNHFYDFYKNYLDNFHVVSFVFLFILLISLDVLNGQTKIYDGLSSKVIGRIENQKLYDGISSKVVARISGWKVYEGLSSKVIFRVDSRGRVYKGLSSKQILKIDGNKVYQGLSSKVITRIDEGKIYKGLSSQVIGRVDGPVNLTELTVILHMVLKLF